MNIASSTTDDHGPPQFAPFPESAFTFGSAGGGVGYTATATLRRVKPLPRSKRRRMSDEQAGLLTPADVVALQQHSTAGVTTAGNPNVAAATFPYGGTTAAMATWTGSMPGGYPAGFAFELGAVYHPQQQQSDEYAGQPANNNNEDDGTGAGGAQDGNGGRDRGDQQGNTKKRKVPAAAHHGHFRGGSSSDDGDVNGVGTGGGDDQLDHRRGDFDGPAGGAGAGAGAGGMNDTGALVGVGKPRLSISAATGMKLKEIAKIRKRLLSSVLGPSASPSSTTAAATAGDGGNLALDIALSAPLKWPPQVSLPTTTEPLASTVRRQRKRTLERKKTQRVTSTAEARCALLSGEFTLEVPSPSSDRMKTTVAEITSYRVKFAQELARISAKQAEAAKKAAAAAANAKNGGAGSMTKKLSPGSKAGSSPGTGAGSKITADGGSTTSKKKKKRSNKANDPHQIRNYIPSRLPSGAGAPQPPTPAQAAQNLKSLISPHPVQFLSAEPKPRSKKRGSNKENAKPAVTSSLPPVQPTDEWICSFCEFNLFYGDDSALRRAVRARKSLLNRRRRARERAAAAASGQGKLLSSAKKGEDSEEDDLPEEEQEAKFVDPAEVDARVAASMGNASRKPVVRDKTGAPPPGGGGPGAVSGAAKA